MHVFFRMPTMRLVIRIERTFVRARDLIKILQHKLHMLRRLYGRDASVHRYACPTLPLGFSSVTHSSGVPRFPLRLLHDVASQPLEVEPFAELRGDDDLPKTLVTGLLPFAKRLGDIDIATGVTEAGMARILSGAFPSDVHPVGTPLAFRPVRRVGHANRTALVEAPDCPFERPESAGCWRVCPPRP